MVASVAATFTLSYRSFSTVAGHPWLIDHVMGRSGRPVRRSGLSCRIEIAFVMVVIMPRLWCLVILLLYRS